MPEPRKNASELKDWFGFFGRECPHCGVHTGDPAYQHSANCLTHVLVELMPHWRDGRDMKPDVSETPEARRAYVMGMNCKEEQLLRGQEDDD